MIPKFTPLLRYQCSSLNGCAFRDEAERVLLVFLCMIVHVHALSSECSRSEVHPYVRVFVKCSDQRQVALHSHLLSLVFEPADRVL